MLNKWKWYAVGEGLTKTVGSILQKLIGDIVRAPASLEVSLLGTLVIGSVQMVGGAVGVIIRKKALRTEKKLIFGSLWFGFFAFMAAVAGFLVFTYDEAELGVVGFIFVAGIVLKALSDRIFFGNALTLRQWFGIAIYLLAGYALFGFPGYQWFLPPPMWVLIACALPLTGTANEIIMRKMSISPVTDPFVNNFWVGLATMLFSILVLGYIRPFGFIQIVPRIAVLLMFFMGLNVLGMISFKLLSYDAGKTTIALKTLVMMSWYLVTTITIGILFFGEPFTSGKITGIFGFIMAYVLIDHETWKTVIRRICGTPL